MNKNNSKNLNVKETERVQDRDIRHSKLDNGKKSVNQFGHKFSAVSLLTYQQLLL